MQRKHIWQREGEKKSDKNKKREDQWNCTNDHVKSMISPGVITGFSSFLNFFFKRLSFNFFLFLISFLIRSVSA